MVVIMSIVGKVQRTFLVLSGCILLLLLSNGVILWKHTQLRNDLRMATANAKALPIEAMISQPIRTSNGEAVTLSSLKSQYVVLFAFTQMDCPPCLAELTTLRRISEIRDDITVYGLMSYANDDEARQTQQNFGFSFPLLQDPEGKILNSLHLPKTPWKIVVSLASKQVVYDDGPSMTKAEREAFITRVTNLGSH